MRRAAGALLAVSLALGGGVARAESVETRLAAETRAPVDEMPSAGGPTGLLHLASARTGPVGAVRTALVFDGFRAPFLCTADQPCGGAARSPRADHAHAGVAVSIGATILGGLELFLVGRAWSNRSSQGADVLETIGETTVGAKLVSGDGAARFGVVGELTFGAGPGRVGLGLAGTSARLRGVFGLALDETSARLPLRLHASLGYLLDNTAALVSDIEAQRSADAGFPRQISRIERFGLGIGKRDRLELAVGLEWLATRARLRPFVEAGIAVPVDRRSDPCTQGAVPDPSLAPDVESCTWSLAATPSRLTLGVRTSPFVGESGTVSLLLGIDLGLTGTDRFVSGVVPQAPYTFWVAVSSSLQATPRPPVVVKEKVDVPVVPPIVTIRGFVHPTGSTTPIVDAKVVYVGGKRPDLSTDATGHFGDDVPPGTYELEIRAPGFKPNRCGGTAVGHPRKAPTIATPWPPAPGQPDVLWLDCPLEPASP